MHTIVHYQYDHGFDIRYAVNRTAVLGTWAWISIEVGRDQLDLSLFPPDRLREIARVAAEAADALEAALEPEPAGNVTAVESAVPIPVVGGE